MSKVRKARHGMDFLSLMNTHTQIRAVVEKEVNAVMDRKLS